jgi:hypothetical protein
MKLRAILGIALAPTILLSGCDNIFGLDNYDEPDSMLSGRVVYDGQPVNVRTGGIELELWQPGFDLLTKIPVYVSQEGHYSAALFAGSYKLNAIRNQGPWLLTDDTVRVEVRGNTTADFPVTPFYLVANPTFNYVAASGVGADTVGNVRATFNIQTVVPEGHDQYRQLEAVELYVAKTQFVDRTNREVQVNVARANLPAGWQTGTPVTLNVALPPRIRQTPSPAPRTHVQARVGIKVVGITEMIFSPVVEIPLPATP